jgi:hypothetical protein
MKWWRMPAPAPWASTSSALAPRGACNNPETLPAFSLTVKRIGFDAALLISFLLSLELWRTGAPVLFDPSAVQITDRHEKHNA